MTEDEMVGWHHRINGHEFEQVPGVCDGQGNQVCGSPCGCKELDTTQLLNNNKKKREVLKRGLKKEREGLPKWSSC